MTDYTDCMSRELKGKLAGKSEAKRKALFKAASKKCSKGSKSKAKSNPKPKSKPKEKVRTTMKMKDTPKKRKLGPLEKTASEYRKEMNDIARALKVPISKVRITFGRTSVTIRIGSILKAKRARFTDAMRDIRKKAKARI